MTDRKTIALFGTGSGLGASLASLFGREGYDVALVARRADPLERKVAELADAGIEAAAFSADLTDLQGIPALVRSIEARFGTIDAAVYAPIPSHSSLGPAAQIDAARIRSLAPLLTLAPIEIAHAVLPGMLARGDGAIVVVAGLSAVVPMAGFAAVGPLMAAARSYVHTLNIELAGTGVYAGSVSIGGMIERSTGLKAAEAGGLELPSTIPMLDPDDIAREILSRITARDRVEAILPPLATA